MGRFIIQGGRPLSGEISVGGSKNAALPIIFASMLTEGVTELSNVPNIGDVDVAFDILRQFGAEILREDDKAYIDTSDLEYAYPDEGLVSKIRASSYLIGATLGRFGKAEIRRFGGCNFDNRPIDMHLDAAMALGVQLKGDTLYAKHLTSGDIYFNNISVGATVNAILLAVSADGVCRIFGYAKEPHIISLIEFFKKGGVRIDLTDECITVFPKKPRSVSFSVIPDMIEAGTYILLSLLTNSEIKVKGAGLPELKSFIMPLINSGAVIEYDKSSITPSGKITDPIEITTAPYPDYPTDLHPQIVPLLAAFSGGKITEGVWRNRFGYLAELSKFGIEYERLEGSAIIKKCKIFPAYAKAPDLRGGAAILLSALFADGESIIENSELIKRGYENIVKKLCAIGADIKEKDT